MSAPVDPAVDPDRGSTADRVRRIGERVEARAEQLIAWRREVHAHPELSHEEHRTTALVAQILGEAGGRVRLLEGTGALVDLGHPEPRERIALRADLDALPIQEVTGLPYSSGEPGVSHACGHDVHTVGLVGAGLALLDIESELIESGIGVRLVFQPAEESNPGGALKVIEEGGLDGVDRMFAVHCDPRVDVGDVGLRVGPITAAADHVHVILSGRGGHSARPHLTQDITYALGKVVTDLPAVLTRRIDPRAGAVLVWGLVRAGSAPNVIPSHGEAMGTLRMLDTEVWDGIGPLVEQAVHDLVAPYGVTATVRYDPHVPPVTNDNASVVAMSSAAMVLMGTDAVRPTEQSMGGEDLGWYLQQVPGAMARLGTRTPGGETYDLHQGDLVVDERSVVMAAQLLAASVLTATR